MSIGARLTIETGSAKIPCEVVGFSGGHALAMPFAALDGVRRGCRAVVTTAAGTIRPSERWLGRVVNARAEPIDGQGPLPPGPAPYPYRSSPPPAHSRRRVGDPLDLGVRALNTFITVCGGQRMGIFSGSGVGKSVLLSMLARNVSADISVIGLVGARYDHRYFQRSGGRRRPQRAGGRCRQRHSRWPHCHGTGHRRARNSISRTMPRAADPAYLPAINRARQVMATYSDMEELIGLGAYRAGSSAEVDEAIGLHKPLEAFLSQSKEEATTMTAGYDRLERILRGEETQN